jgi:hypothetical protein
LPPYSRFPAELASILLLAFSLFALVAALLFVFRKPLFINLYRIYVCYTNIMLYIAFGILSAVSRNRDRSCYILPVDTGAHLYLLGWRDGC